MEEEAGLVGAEVAAAGEAGLVEEHAAQEEEAPEAEAAQEEEAQEAVAEAPEVVAEAPAGTATEEEARLEVPRPRRQQNVPGPKFKFHSPFTVPLLSRLCVQLLMEFLPLHSRLSAG